MLILNGGQGTVTITTDSSNAINTASGTAGIIVPVGSQAQRPANAVAGTLRYNTTISNMEIYANGSWAALTYSTPPFNTVAPAITGTTNVGQTLAISTGTWTQSPTSYAYQWLANSSPITNATSNTFTLTTSEEGKNVSCNVTAFNAAGNATAVSNTVGPITNTYTISYLAIAGGGSGTTAMGGGGAGGMVESTTTLAKTYTYTITVGGGGAGGGSGVYANGSNTTITATATGFSNITIIGGGTQFWASNGTGCPGGSGGGGQGYSGGYFNGGNGTAGQGYAGGHGYASPSTDYYQGGGGGGAGGAGSNSPGQSTGGNGGSGATTNITGTPTTYAGGGGGGGYIWNGTGSNGSGGSGGGGNGGRNGLAGTSGTAYTGSGGGAGSLDYQANPVSSGSGASGIVILSIDTANFSNSYTGSNVIVTTNGGYTILKYSASGTYTA